MAASGGPASAVGRIRLATTGLIAAVVATTVFLGPVYEAEGHGFHNTALTTSSLDQWLQDVKQVIPDLEERMITTRSQPGRKGPAPPPGTAPDGTRPELPPGRVVGTIETRLTPAQREVLNRKASDCMQILAHLSPQNVIPEEFPTFDISRIPEYRSGAKQLLKLMGRESTGVVVGRIENELMAGGGLGTQLPLHSDFHGDLLEILESLANEGNLTPEHVGAMLQAAEGRKKTPAQQELASKVQHVFIDSADLPTFARTFTNSANRRLRNLLLNKADEKIDKANVLELLQARERVKHPVLKRKISEEFRRRSPKYAEVEDQLDGLWRLAQSDDADLADDARKHVENAFQRAQISECLKWIGRDDERLDELIWEQIDGRIERADAARRQGYRNSAVTVIQLDRFNAASKRAALELMTRLDDDQAASLLVDLLPKMSRDLWPEAGRTLHELTGQDFGPHPDDGPVEVLAAIKQWRAWLREGRGP